MDDIDKKKLGVMSNVEQMRADFEEWFSKKEYGFENAILDVLDIDPETPELMAIYGMAKIFYFEEALKREPPFQDLSATIIDKEPPF